MKLKKLEIIKLWNAIDACKEFKNTNFIYGALKTKKKIAEEVELLTELSKTSKKYTEYQKERIKLCQQYASKDGDGVFIIENGEYSFTPENRPDFDEKHTQLRERFKDWIEEREEQIENYDKVLKEEIEIDIHCVDIKNVPQDLNAYIMEGLLPLIQD